MLAWGPIFSVFPQFRLGFLNEFAVGGLRFAVCGSQVRGSQRQGPGGTASSRSAIPEAPHAPDKVPGYIDAADLFVARRDARPPQAGANHALRGARTTVQPLTANG